MVDWYTKIVLTVIALALVILTLRPVFHPQSAVAQQECGRESNPCWTFSYVYNAEPFRPRPGITSSALEVTVRR